MKYFSIFSSIGGFELGYRIFRVWEHDLRDGDVIGVFAEGQAECLCIGREKIFSRKHDSRNGLAKND